MRDTGITATVYMGDKDKVLSPKRIQRIVKKLSHFSYVEISAGHDIFKPNLLPKFVAIVKAEIHE